MGTYPLNPLRAGLVEDMKALDKHPWCGHSVLMNRNKQPWQNVDYVYGLFSRQKRQARQLYRAFVEKGVAEGSRPDLVGGGLLSSSGGWKILKGLRKEGIRVKGDERILGDGDFVKQILESAEEALAMRYDLEARGYDFNRVVERAAEVMGMHVDQVTAYGKSPQTVKARSLLCFWAHRKLGMTTVAIAKRLKIGQSAVSRSSLRGAAIARENQYELM